MARTSRARHDDDRSHRIHEIAARREAARRAKKRNRMILAIGSTLAVAAAGIVIGVVTAGSPAAPVSSASPGPTGAALAATVRDLTTVPARTLDAVGGGSLATADIGSSTTVGGGYLTPVAGSPLTAAGKPELLYVGADFCPYCAAVRWPLIVALSRFGSFSGLTTARSGVTAGSGAREPYPATPTWTFYGSSYTSPYLTFTSVEISTSVPDKATGGYTALQVPTAGQQATLAKYDPSGGIPFIDIGGRYVQLSILAPYGPQDLAGSTWSQLTAAVRNPSSAPGRGIDGSANYLTAAICQLTGNRPASACTATIRALPPRLG